MQRSERKQAATDSLSKMSFQADTKPDSYKK
jgi:hypothetical protein